MNRTIANGRTEQAHDAAFDASRLKGVLGHDFRDRQYGRRVEADRSWIVYHVFTGIPAHVDGVFLVGLTRAHATRSMLGLNCGNAEALKAREEVLPAPERAEMQEGRP
jgi:hypothetical protein